MLEVRGLAVTYGATRALAGVDLTVAPAEIVALIGHNGAGKTTLLRAAMGLAPITAGAITFGGAPVVASAAAMVRHGLVFVPQGRGVFRDLTVDDNLKVARAGAGGGGLPERYIVDVFPVLRERATQIAGTLSGGQQQMLALALALVKAPKLILLDEPSTGLSPVLVEGVFATIRRVSCDLGTAFLVIDQNARRLLAASSRAYVLKSGCVIASGNAGELASKNLWTLF